MESPRKTDIIYARDEYNKLLKDGNGNKIRKKIRWYTETDTDMYAIWTYENAELLTRLRLSEGQKITHKDTFTKYRPSHIKHTDFLALFACDVCIPFEYLLTATNNILTRFHTCKTGNCPNYNAITMGSNCNCEHCNDCIVDHITSVPGECLLEDVCCDNDNEVVPWLQCITGDCLHECIDKYPDLILHGTGCHTLNIPDGTIMNYKSITDFPIDRNKKHKRKCVIVKQMPWGEYRTFYASKFKQYIQHRYAKKWQFRQRQIITSPINNTIILPQDILFASIDFIANIPLRSKTTTHGSGTKIASIQLCVIYDVYNNNNTALNKSAYSFLSDVTDHGWYSAIPMMRKYIQRRKREFRLRGITLKTLILWSDRGPTDFWTSPFIMYCADICIRNNINLNVNTTAVGHGKWLHDQIGAVIKRIIIYIFKHGYIDVTASDSIASKTVNYLNLNHSSSANNTIHRYFILLSPSEIRVSNSQVPTIKGIKSYRNIHININKEIKVRNYSCNCACCLLTDFTLCTKDMYCTDWRRLRYDKTYPTYDAMILRTDVGNVGDSNHNR